MVTVNDRVPWLSSEDHDTVGNEWCIFFDFTVRLTREFIVLILAMFSRPGKYPAVLRKDGSLGISFRASDATVDKNFCHKDGGAERNMFMAPRLFCNWNDLHDTRICMCVCHTMKCCSVWPLQAFFLIFFWILAYWVLWCANYTMIKIHSSLNYRSLVFIFMKIVVRNVT